LRFRRCDEGFKCGVKTRFLREIRIGVVERERYKARLRGKHFAQRQRTAVELFFELRPLRRPRAMTDEDVERVDVRDRRVIVDEDCQRQR